MYVIIVGCGGLGSTLAMELSDEGHDVAVIDNDDENLDRLGSGFNGHRIRGIEYDTDILLEAGIDKADFFLALTYDDNINLTASQIAKNIFNVSGVIARVCEPQKKFIYEKLGIETITPTELGVNIIKTRITNARVSTLFILSSSLEIIETDIPKAKLKTVKDFEDEFNCIVSAVLRGDTYKIPDSGQLLQPRDKIICTIDSTNKERLIASLSKELLI
ncbi:potassium channel family protein [Fonticella tunisiensis]|uniref:Trk system potassium uptake protein TrkA n=1 Tax=Fonticella tunisiensis TaxID=1096341 RepID=A0A4R7KAW6_9CLOT|nr:NAD-binding protein [Fonticella tunisiensis]TDT52042.1 trk system potassium uptake protein TrkA [Fonticella tunisiensis]